ncbi:hypothetical protein F4824DRAFT_496600 [Ustulina deusta]|nr:hypothetical protein F4823DRAFT_227858 [Ustulina deusta]KAI3340992.1 hypothetical protein F4824DRAFT_496600 [Ustulina deusta]
MPILEIAQPKLKRDPALIQELREKVVPGLLVSLAKAGAVNALVGFFETENGRDVKEEWRQILVFEWPAVQNFKDFVASAGYLEFGGKMKQRYADGPAELKLFEVGDGVSSLFGSDTVLEYLVIKPKDASEASVQNVLQQLQSRLPQFGTAKVVVGGSSNLETREIALVGLYASDAELDTAKASTARQQLLADIVNTADVTSLVAHVQRVLPLP